MLFYKPMYSNRVPTLLARLAAGHPYHVDGALERVELSELLNMNASCIVARIAGDSLDAADVSDGDMVVIDREAVPRHGDLVVAELEDGYTVKKYQPNAERRYLQLVPVSNNRDHKPITCNCKDDCEIVGVVTMIIKNVRRRL